ncbi:hypothetical protein M6B22_08610 [Jatrophihabitans cynanchi]|uniref:Uncharacterized protein n=1 Tax=Jatrophihabitans cynanchi TaxID=2944128 RepID=A0ABY7K1W8_9ACTN|nr:hypothetical protein [Jatrophihabitans sp. SB3-54]WAX58812.1 hypothetical protein M6B22_08610 [Jatrophihabitans sp. SB3-54]
MSTLMWEVRAADGRCDELVAYVRAHADPGAQVYRSADGEPRVVVIDPTGSGVPDVPEELIARPAHQWRFVPVP